MLTLSAVDTATGEIQEARGDACSEWLIAHGYHLSRVGMLLHHVRVHGYLSLHEDEWQVKIASWDRRSPP